MTQNWTIQEATNIFELPFNDLIFRAHTIFRKFFNPNKLQASTLSSIKTGGCPENCSYCPQSAHYNTGLSKQPLMEESMVVEQAQKAKRLGASRFCLGAAWRGPNQKDLMKVCSMIAQIKRLGLDTCASLGILKFDQAQQLKESGLDYYNHNLDTSPSYYKQIITTRTFQDRLETLSNVRKAGIKVCCGGIIGMGETKQDRLKMITLLANFEFPPESIPINKLIPIPGTPMEDIAKFEALDFVRIIATTRIMVPKAYVRLSAGRHDMSEELQALCFFAGSNSIFYGEKLLTAPNSAVNEDDALLLKLGITLETNEKIVSPAN